jgi:hypothetical protein
MFAMQEYRTQRNPLPSGNQRQPGHCFLVQCRHDKANNTFGPKSLFFCIKSRSTRKKNRKKRKKQNRFSFLTEKSLFCLVHVHGGKNQKMVLILSFLSFFLIKNHFHVKWTKKKSFCFDLKISLFLYDWSIDADKTIQTPSHIQTTGLIITKKNQVKKQMIAIYYEFRVLWNFCCFLEFKGCLTP